MTNKLSKGLFAESSGNTEQNSPTLLKASLAMRERVLELLLSDDVEWKRSEINYLSLMLGMADNIHISTDALLEGDKTLRVAARNLLVGQGAVYLKREQNNFDIGMAS